MARRARPTAAGFYFSSEAEQSLHVVDGKTLQTTKKIPLTGRPNNISIASDGRRVYVGIVSAPGAVDVIDTMTLESVKSIPTKGGIHNVYVTPDGKHVVAGSIAGRLMTVIDQKTEEPVWTLFEEGVRPMAFETNPDGSTKRIFVQLSDFHGFAVVDFAQRKEVAPNRAAERRPGGEGRQGSVQRIAVARPRCRARWKDAVGDEPAERARVYVLAAGPEAAAWLRRSRRSPRLGDVHARQQAALHRDREHRHRSSRSTSPREKRSRRSRWASRRSATSRGWRVARARCSATVLAASRSLVSRHWCGGVDDGDPARRHRGTRAAGPEEDLPDGEGKKILRVLVHVRATICSEVTKFRGYYDRKQWRDIVVTMMEYGAPVDEKQVDILADYLAEHLGKQ